MASTLYFRAYGIVWGDWEDWTDEGERIERENREREQSNVYNDDYNQNKVFDDVT